MWRRALPSAIGPCETLQPQKCTPTAMTPTACTTGLTPAVHLHVPGQTPVTDIHHCVPKDLAAIGVHTDTGIPQLHLGLDTALSLVTACTTGLVSSWALQPTGPTPITGLHCHMHTHGHGEMPPAICHVPTGKPCSHRSTQQLPEACICQCAHSCPWPLLLAIVLTTTYVCAIGL